VLLIIFAFVGMIWFTLLHGYSFWQWTFLITLPFFILHLISVMKSDSAGMDKYLKQLAIATLLLVLCFGISVSLNPYV
jgi:1,4-dihydroxy-2-naphthoate polyprenyltransferase